MVYVEQGFFTGVDMLEATKERCKRDIAEREERIRKGHCVSKAREVAKVNENNAEKATLGDLDALKSLKEDLEKEGK